MAIMHHRGYHRNLVWYPNPQPRQTGSPEGGCYKAGGVLRKSGRGNYGKRVSPTTKRPRTAITPRAIPPPRAPPPITQPLITLICQIKVGLTYT